MNPTSFLAGVAMMTFLASGVFFLKFWKASRDRFFLYFCIACWLLASERVVGLFVLREYEAITISVLEANSWIYLIRLCAFAFILIAILEKNRPRKV